MRVPEGCERDVVIHGICRQVTEVAEVLAPIKYDDQVTELPPDTDSEQAGL
jgi:hypothetical protein